MNKKLIAVSIAGVLAAPLAAQAGVEVYGRADVSVDYSNNSDNQTDASGSAIGVSSTASRLGFKGDEDMGNGLSALWQLEEGVDFSTNNGNSSGYITDSNGNTVPVSGTNGVFTPRTSFLGLGGGFGTVLAGKLDTPYKSSTEKFDPFQDTKADFNGIMGNVGSSNNMGDIRGAVGNQAESSALYDLWTNNTLAYVSPNAGGFQVKLAYVAPSAITGNDALPMNKADKKQSAYDVGGTYDMGAVSLIADYVAINKAVNLGSVLFNNTGTDDYKNLTAWKIGGAYTIRDATTLALIYESAGSVSQDRSATYEVKSRNAYYFSASHKIGETTLKLAYANADKSGGNADDNGAYQISVGASQELSKNTDMYALFTMLHNNGGGEYSLAYGPANAVAGKNEDVLSIGLTHLFSSK